MKFEKRIYGSPGVKAALKQITHNKCAYCESKTTHVAHGDVEHFRPKAKYWWLAYTWENLVFACQICNQSYKGDFFPVAGPCANCPGSVLAREKALLINPLEENPEDFFLYREGLEGIELVPASSRGLKRRRAEACIKYFGLNRPDLCDERKKRYSDVRFNIAISMNPHVPPNERDKAREKLAEWSRPQFQYAGMVRYYLKKCQAKI